MGSNTHVTCNEVNAITSHESCRGHVTFWSVMCIDISTVRIFQSKNKTLDWSWNIYTVCYNFLDIANSSVLYIYLWLTRPVCVCAEDWRWYLRAAVNRSQQQHWVGILSCPLPSPTHHLQSTASGLQPTPTPPSTWTTLYLYLYWNFLIKRKTFLILWKTFQF